MQPNALFSVQSIWLKGCYINYRKNLFLRSNWCDIQLLCFKMHEELKYFTTLLACKWNSGYTNYCMLLPLFPVQSPHGDHVVSWMYNAVFHGNTTNDACHHCIKSSCDIWIFVSLHFFVYTLIAFRKQIINRNVCWAMYIKGRVSMLYVLASQDSDQRVGLIHCHLKPDVFSGTLSC